MIIKKNKVIFDLDTSGDESRPKRLFFSLDVKIDNLQYTISDALLGCILISISKEEYFLINEQMEVDCFICSKPLQYLNVKNIPRNEGHKRVLVFIPNFVDGEDFVNKVRLYDKDWDEVVMVPTPLKSHLYILFHKCDVLYWGYDMGTFEGLLYKIKKFKFVYYEEGYGMYDTDIVVKGKFQRLVDNWLGVSMYKGHSKFVSSAYCYKPDKFLSIVKPTYPVYSFALDFMKILECSMSLFLHVSSGDIGWLAGIKEKKVVLYLTSWDINNKIVQDISSEDKNYDLILIKPHPHIRNFVIDFHNARIIRSNLMAEFVVLLLLKNNNRLTIFHEGSAAMQFFDKSLYDNREYPMEMKYN